MSYSAFKRAVLDAAGFQCENPACDEHTGLTVHHFLKQSTFPQYAEDVDNGMCACGRCHTEIERRLRSNEDWLELYPIGRYRKMLAKAGVEAPEGFDAPARRSKAASLERHAQELLAGQAFLEGMS